MAEECIIAWSLDLHAVVLVHLGQVLVLILVNLVNGVILQHLDLAQHLSIVVPNLSAGVCHSLHSHMCHVMDLHAVVLVHLGQVLVLILVNLVNGVILQHLDLAQHLSIVVPNLSAGVCHSLHSHMCHVMPQSA